MGRGTSRRLVEGAQLRAICDDPTEHAIEVVGHVSRRNSDDLKPLTVQYRITSGVAARLIAKVVTLSIYLSNQAPFQAREINRHLANRKLLSEL
jgi:hypothetical protein